ncbi:MAG: hypothetical protein KPEEDBHJ_02537 [Anaerolineales bacterium]|nr:hypothetical protein [Anaerolineales bacterium]
MLSVHLFGALRVLNEGRPLDSFPTQRSRELFAYLAANPNMAHSRLALASLLWPDKTEARARASLNTELWRIRQVLGDADSHLELTRDTIALNIPAGGVDIHRFHELIQTNSPDSIKQAVALAAGDFFEGCYADWCLIERERLADKYRSALYALLRYHEARSELTEAMAAAKHLAGFDPLHEESHRAIMRLYSAMGDRSAALTQYERCCELLRRELNVPPMPETEALYRKIFEQAGGETVRAMVRPEKAFVGRGDILEEVSGFWERARAGKTSAVLLMGESGIGKTRAAGHWLSLRQSQAVILRGRCSELNRQSAFYPALEMLQQGMDEFGPSPLDALPLAFAADLQKFFPGLQKHLRLAQNESPLPPALARARLARAFDAGLRAFAEPDRPLILFFDDLQWADTETFDLIAGFMQDADAPAIFILATYRHDPLDRIESNRRDDWFRNLGFDSLRLGPLSKDDTARMIRELGKLNDAPSRFAERIYAETEGSPLFIVETLRGLFDAGHLSVNADGVWAIPLDRQQEGAVRLPLPASLREVIRARVARLAEDHKRALETGAILGSRFDADALRVMSGLKAEVLDDALRELLRLGLVEETASGYEISHVRIRDYLLDGMNENDRSDLHRRAANFLNESPNPPLEQIAYHFQQCGQTDLALAALEQAGEAAMKISAYKSAAEHFESALQLMKEDEDGSARLGILLKLYRCLWGTSHDLNRLEIILEEARAIAEATGDEKKLAEVYYHSGVNRISRGEWAQAQDWLEKSLRHAAKRLPEIEMKARLEMTNILQFMRIEPEAREHGWQALALARSLGDIRAEERARWDLAEFDMNAVNQSQLGLEIAERAFETGTFELIVDLGSSIVGALLRAGNPGAALAQAERFLAFGREQGIGVFVKTIQRAQARVLLEIGQYETALILLKEALTASRLTNYRYGEMRALACLGMCYAGLGDEEEALGQLTRAEELAEGINSKMDVNLIRVDTIAVLIGLAKPQALSRAESLALQVLSDRDDGLFQGSVIFAMDRLARVHFARGNFDESLRYAGEAVRAMERPANRDIALDPRVYFTHYLILERMGDEKAARALRWARDTLCFRARTLLPRLRRDYLRRVSPNREICRSR